jgi:hypothetical protein
MGSYIFFCINASHSKALDLRAQLVSQRETFDSDRQKGKQIAASERRQTKVTLSPVKPALSHALYIFANFTHLYIC